MNPKAVAADRLDKINQSRWFADLQPNIRHNSDDKTVDTATGAKNLVGITAYCGREFHSITDCGIELLQSGVITTTSYTSPQNHRLQAITESQSISLNTLFTINPPV